MTTCKLASSKGTKKKSKQQQKNEILKNFLEKLN